MLNEALMFRNVVSYGSSGFFTFLGLKQVHSNWNEGKLRIYIVQPPSLSTWTKYINVYVMYKHVYYMYNINIFSKLVGPRV